MSTYGFPDKDITLRKPQKCWICLELMTKGERSIKRSGVDSEGWVNMYMHPECKDYTDETLSYDDWESLFPGDISRKEVIDWVRRNNG